MQFQTLLDGLRIDATRVALCLHKPGNARDRLTLMNLAAAQAPEFETYQSTHSRQAEATLKARDIMASFITRGDGSLGFVGLYRQAGWQERSAAEFDADPDMQAMFAYFADPSGFVPRGIGTRAQFTLAPMTELADLRGRLIVSDPGARAYMRLAERTPLDVVAITALPDLAPQMPDWRALVVDAETLRALPRTWADTLRHWRGIYLITDSLDGARYVGAAYGAENLLGRWRAHVAGDLGVTRELSRRDPRGFSFSILELLSPVAEIAEVTQLEQTWMDRLHTRRYGLNA
ncbi:MAG: GIY-YIG nuclease family protein [Rhodobacteraceae bacterium]|nr:MAG: GIY-YIG nuclease family protein [Paracoccaceae bacterium]